MTVAAANLWPELMRAETAARYVDEPSPRAFRRRVGKVYSKPVRIAGRRDAWRKKDLDRDIARLRGASGRTAINDAADVL
jgi:hypothetical protein